MKYCTKCGGELVDEAIVCPHCGVLVDEKKASAVTDKSGAETSTLKLIAKIFMLLGCVVLGIYLIPLCWTIPMTVHYWKAVKEHRPVSTGFKVCALLFVSTVGGILMLCDNSDD